jgi:hypothetical protein
LCSIRDEKEKSAKIGVFSTLHQNDGIIKLCNYREEDNNQPEWADMPTLERFASRSHRAEDASINISYGFGI